MRVEINRAGKFGTILARFGTKTISEIYMRVKINRAGVFGPKIFTFRMLFCNSHFPIYMHTHQLLECIQLQLSYFEMINILWLPCSTLRLNSKILNLQNNHFGHLTSLKDNCNRFNEFSTNAYLKLPKLIYYVFFLLFSK